MTRQEYYEKYDDHVKLNLEQKHKLEYLVNEIVVLLRNAGISHSPGVEPMTDVDQLRFCFPANGEPDKFGLDIGSYGSCLVVVAMAPEPGREAAEEHVMHEEGRARTP